MCFGVTVFIYTCVFLQIKTPAQLEAAFSFFATTGSETFKDNDFEEACGVGMIWKFIPMLNIDVTCCQISCFSYRSLRYCILKVFFTSNFLFFLVTSLWLCLTFCFITVYFHWPS